MHLEKQNDHAENYFEPVYFNDSDVDFFQLFHDIRLVWTSENAIDKKLVHSSFCQLGDCIFRVPDYGSGQPYRLSGIFAGTAKDYPGSSDTGRIYPFCGYIHEPAVQNRLYMGRLVPAGSGLLYVQKLIISISLRAW